LAADFGNVDMLEFILSTGKTIVILVALLYTAWSLIGTVPQKGQGRIGAME